MIFTALTLVLGSLWGRPVWGIWWAWDARLVTTAVLFFLYLGYLALRRIPAATRRRARSAARSPRSIAFVDVPIVHFSVEWWRTLHQKAPCSTRSSSAKIHGVMAFTLWFGVIAFTLLYVYLLDRRYRLAGARGAPWSSARSTRRSPSASALPVASATRSRLGEQLADELRRVRHHRLGAHRRGHRRVLGCGSCGAPDVPSDRCREAERVTTVAPPASAPAAATAPTQNADPVHRRRSAAACVAVVAIVVLAVVLVRERRVLPHRLRSGEGPRGQGTARFRLAGAVVPETIVDDRSDGVDFEVTDGKNTVTVVHHAATRPTLFKAGAPVVCEGHWASKASNAPFDSPTAS